MRKIAQMVYARRLEGVRSHESSRYVARENSYCWNILDWRSHMMKSMLEVSKVSILGLCVAKGGEARLGRLRIMWKHVWSRNKKSYDDVQALVCIYLHPNISYSTSFKRASHYKMTKARARSSMLTHKCPGLFMGFGSASFPSSVFPKFAKL